MGVEFHFSYRGWDGMGWCGSVFPSFWVPAYRRIFDRFFSPLPKNKFSRGGGGGLLDAYVKRKKLFSAKNRGGFVAVDRLDYQHRVTCPTISFHVLILLPFYKWFQMLLITRDFFAASRRWMKSLTTSRQEAIKFIKCLYLKYRIFKLNLIN